MDLKSGYPFWTVSNGLPANFAPLLDDKRCDVAIVGGGITGALIARQLSAAGLDVIVVEKRDVGWGSTSASTALLQYEIDTELGDLCRQFGEERAVMAYRACESALGSLAELAHEVRPVGFRTMKSLYYASRWHHASRVRKEGELRQRHGFDLEILERDALLERCGIRAPVALLTKVAAEVDPYRLTYAILQKLQKAGVEVFDRSEMLSFKATRTGVELSMQRDVTVRCKHLVLAGGYETQQYVPQRVASNRSSYALVTEPLIGPKGPLPEMLIWESARPYLYVRTTGDGRALVGGEDDRVDIPLKRDAAVPFKAKRLMKKLRAMLPTVTFEESFAWAGTFAETADGLPFFGAHRKLGSRVHFAMAYGGNGITYSAIGAEILRAALTRKKHALSKFFSFDRLD